MSSLTSSPTKKIDDKSMEEDQIEKAGSPKEEASGSSIAAPETCDEEMKSDKGDGSTEDSSDSEEYSPESDSDNNSDADGELSAEEEEGFEISASVQGDMKFLKMKFADVEEKRKQYLSELRAAEEGNTSSSDDENDKKEESSTSRCEPMSDQISKAQFSGYRSLLMNLGESNYKSDDDDDFNPMYCGETLSDEEIDSDDERNTESEPEVERLEEKSKKTGEPLQCIKMMKNYLSIPPEHEPNEEDKENIMEH